MHDGVVMAKILGDGEVSLLLCLWPIYKLGGVSVQHSTSDYQSGVKLFCALFPGGELGLVSLVELS